MVNEENTEHDELDSEGSCLKKEHVKVLVLGSQKENLTVDGMKVRIPQLSFTMSRHLLPLSETSSSVVSFARRSSHLVAQGFRGAHGPVVY